MSQLETTTYNGNNVWKIAPEIKFDNSSAYNSTALLSTKGKYLDKDILIISTSKMMELASVDAVVSTATVATTNTVGEFYIEYNGIGSSNGYISTDTKGESQKQYIKAAQIAAVSSADAPEAIYKPLTNIVLSEGGTIKIDAGYIDNTQITLATIIPDDYYDQEKMKKVAAGVEDLKSGSVLFDGEGHAVVGTMIPSTHSFLKADGITRFKGDGVKFTKGYLDGEVTVSLGDLISSGGVSTATGPSAYYSTNSSGNVVAESEIGDYYLTKAHYIKRGSIDSSITLSGGEVEVTPTIASTAVTTSKTDNSSGIAITSNYNYTRSEISGSITSTSGWIDSTTISANSSQDTSSGNSDPYYLTGVTIKAGKEFTVANQGKLNLTNSGSVSTAIINGGGEKGKTGITLIDKVAKISDTNVTDTTGKLITATCVHSDANADWSQTVTEEITPSVAITGNIAEGSILTSTTPGKNYLTIKPDASVTKEASGTVQPKFKFSVVTAGWIGKIENAEYQEKNASTISLNDSEVKDGQTYYIEVYDGSYVN